VPPNPKYEISTSFESRLIRKMTWWSYSIGIKLK
jgi:hypothetical protein